MIRIGSLILLAGTLLLLPCRAVSPAAPPATSDRPTLFFFWGVGCPHCARAKPFLEELRKKYPRLEVRAYEVMEQRNNIPLLMAMAKERGEEATGVPTFFIGARMFSGFSQETARELEETVRTELAAQPPATPPAPSPAVTLPLVGRMDAGEMSLPVFTIVIAGLDSFNPCAFFVLLFLLSLLVHAHSRTRMLAIGGIFVFFSGLFYFLFMAAWLNLFLLAGQLALVTAVAGVVALLIALINIKDFFLFKKGVSLTLPEEAKPRLFERMRHLLKAGSLPSLVAGTVVLAAAANSYELLCTAGFPMVFTRVLTLHALPPTGYYLYLLFYNTVYVVPLAVIVVAFVITLGNRKLSEWQGRVLKLLSGLMMLALGLVLLVDPALLDNALASALLLAAVLAIAAVIVSLTKRFAPHLTEG
jgi:thiol-disulfide isomerase/thioredoxin